jgi:hypothetical protein
VVMLGGKGEPQENEPEQGGNESRGNGGG